METKLAILPIIGIFAMLFAVPCITAAQSDTIQLPDFYKQSSILYEKNYLMQISSTEDQDDAPVAVGDTTDVHQFYKSLESFALRLFTRLSEENPDKNVVISPFSIQTCLSMARMGAEGQTALQIDQALTLSSQNPQDLANKYHAILAKYEKSTMLQMANKIYAMHGYTLQDEFNALLSQQFYSSVEFLDFANNVPAAQTINSWVEKKTNNFIKNLVDPNSLSATTRLVLVNAIHINGNWVNQFWEWATREYDFYLDDNKTIKVLTMLTTAQFKYANLSALDATAVEMPYKDSDLSMLVIVPNKPTGLVELLRKLNHISLANVTSQLTVSKVQVTMPKFKAEFPAELSGTLSKMGMERMFSSDAEFGRMLKENGDFHVSSVVHKTFIDVNERGTEAAAATDDEFMDKMGDSSLKYFNADRPFYYAIKNELNLILFAGTFKKNL